MLPLNDRLKLADALAATGSPEAAVDTLAGHLPAYLHVSHPEGARRRMQVVLSLRKMVWLLGLENAVAALRTKTAPLPAVDDVDAPEWAGRDAGPLPEMTFDGRRFAAELVRAGSLAVGDYYVPAVYPELRSPREVTAATPFARGELLQLRYFVAGEDRERFYDPQRAVVRLLPAD